MKTQMSEPSLSLGDLVTVVQIMGFWMEKIVIYFRSHYLNLCFLLLIPVSLLWYLPPMQPYSCQMSHLHASEAPLPLPHHRVLRAHCGRWVVA